MGNLRSICSAIKAAFFGAEIEISSLRSFEAIVEILELLFEVEFSSSKRFDEVPAKIALVDHHEIILFGIPEGELEGDEDFQFYRLSLFPKAQPPDARIEDITALLIDELKKSGIEAKVSR